MKTKSIVKSAGSGALAVPQYTLAGTGMLLGGVETVLRTAANGVGFLKDKSFEGEKYFENLREEISADIAEFEAAAAAEDKARRKKATA